MYGTNLSVAKNTKCINANEPKEAKQGRLGYEEHEAGTNPPLRGGAARVERLLVGTPWYWY